MSESSGTFATTYDQVWASLDVFDPTNLRTGEDIKRAVNILQTFLDDRSIVGSIIQYCLRHSNYYTLEFILSGTFGLFPLVFDPQPMLATEVSGAHATHILTFLLNGFPSKIGDFYVSIGYRVISRLSCTLESLPFATAGKPDGLDDHLQHWKMALAALNELRLLLQGEDVPRKDVVSKKKSNKRAPQLSNASQPSANLEGAVQRFKAMGLQFPRTRLSADEMTQKIIDAQRKVLKVHLLLLFTLHFVELNHLPVSLHDNSEL
jgi:hypothetical protein